MVEAVSGLPLDEYFQANITGPLGMTSTTARMTAAQRANSAPIHVRGEDGAWVVTDIDWAQQPDFWGGGHFLYSTPRDYFWVDPASRVTGSIGSQLLPFGDPAAFQLYLDFAQALYATL